MGEFPAAIFPGLPLWLYVDQREYTSESAFRLNRNLPPDLDHLIGREAEKVADVNGIALHHGKEGLLPSRQALAVLAADHRLVADVIGDVVEIDCAAQR